MSSPRVRYTPRSDTSAETEVFTLANIYSFVLRCRKKNAPGVTSTKGDDAKGSRNDRANEKYSRT